MYLNILHEYNRDLYETKARFKFFVKKKKNTTMLQNKRVQCNGKKLSEGKRIESVNILQNYSPS